MRWLAPLLVLLAAVAAACSSDGNAPKTEAPPRSPRETAERFFSLWQAKKYDAMYALLSSEAQATIDREKFTGRYEAIDEEATITGVDFQLGTPDPAAENDLPVTVTVHTSFFGDI